MRRKFIYLINPISGTREKSKMESLIRQRTEAAGIHYEIMPTVADGNYEAVRQKIEKEQFTDIIICGGDGTVNQVVHSLADTKVRFGIIPLGSGNGLAFAAGIPKAPPKALEVIFKGYAQLTDAFMINNRFACMLCGLGFDAAIAHQFAEAPRRGLGTYASLTTKHFLLAKAYPFSIHANNFDFSTEAYLVSIANSNQFGNNFTIAPQAILSDGLLDVVIVKKIAKPLLLITVMKQVLAGQIKKVENSMKSPVIYFQTAELTIQNAGHAPMHIDGDPCDTEEQLTIKVLPRYFNLIQAAE
jgi:diacylglycerol kinase (ATP)